MDTPAILQLLNRATGNPAAGRLAQIKDTIGKIKGMGNPQAMLQQMIQQRSPHLTQAVDYIKQHGGNPKAAFEALAAEQGVDPKEIEALLK